MVSYPAYPLLTVSYPSYPLLIVSYLSYPLLIVSYPSYPPTLTRAPPPSRGRERTAIPIDERLAAAVSPRRL